MKTFQQGSVLLISLVVLVMLTLMVFGLNNSIILQERIVGDTRTDSLALEVAESALIDAEQFLAGVQLSSFTKEGNNGLYFGECEYEETDCYAMRTLPTENLFSASTWGSDNSREATTAIKCFVGESCPLTDEYEKGRFKAIYLGHVSSGDSIRVITSQLQDANDTFLSEEYKLFKIIATGTSADEGNRRVLVSYFVAPVLE